MRLTFDAIASQFDQQRGLPQAAIEGWVELVDQISGGRTLNVVEPGIGTGRIALPIAALGHQVAGLDTSPEMLAQCREAASRLRLSDRVSLVVGDATDLQFVDHQFDLGVIAQLLYLVSDWPTVLDELARVVKPGGRVIHLTEPTAMGHELALWSTTWREMIETTGYQHSALTPTDADVHTEFLRRWPDVQVRELASWDFGQTVSDAMVRYAERVRPLYDSVPELAFDRAIQDFLVWANDTFLEGDTRLGGTVTLTATIASI